MVEIDVIMSCASILRKLNLYSELDAEQMYQLVHICAIRDNPLVELATAIPRYPQSPPTQVQIQESHHRGIQRIRTRLKLADQQLRTHAQLGRLV